LGTNKEDREEGSWELQEKLGNGWGFGVRGLSASRGQMLQRNIPTLNREKRRENTRSCAEAKSQVRKDLVADRNSFKRWTLTNGQEIAD